MKSVAFRREREATWLELERLVGRAERDGLGSLTRDEIARLPIVYRATLSSLSVARAISLDASLLAYLESLSARAYVIVYGAKRGAREAIAAFVARRFRSAVHALRRQVAVSLSVMLLGVLTGHVLTSREPARFYSFVSQGMAGGRSPASTTAELRDVLYSGREAGDLLAAFAMFLFTHNAAVGMLCFATGFVGGVPTLVLLFSNGLMLGGFSGLYAGRDLGLEFWAWVLPHGVTELMAVVLCGAAGLALGDALLFPGRHARLAHLARAGRQAGLVVMGAVAMFFLAGLVEGVFRQVVHDVGIRLAVAAASAAAWAAYFGRSNGGADEQ